MKTIRITLTVVASDDIAEKMKNEILCVKMQRERETADDKNCKSVKITYEEIKIGSEE